ncbi:MAG TPA: MFS transporter [Steroidobacteraceae bacterium]|nr:MFS transporter [Steroidobacteraceae bacterium]
MWRCDYDDLPVRPFHWRIGTASTGGVFADGFGLGIIGIALSLAAPELGLDPAWLGLLGGASLAGLFAGALLTGPTADRLGRRPIYASNMALAALVSSLQFAVHSRAQLLALRLAIGFLLGTDYVVSKALLTEFVPRQLRGRVLGIFSVAWAGGYASAYAAGYALTGAGPQPWRWMLLASAAPCLLVAPLRMSIPESPLWLAHHGRRERAIEIARGALGVEVELPRQSHARSAPRTAWTALFSPRWRVRTAVACTFFACQVIPYFAVGTFISEVMAALNLKGVYAGGLIYNLALVAGAVAGLLIVNRISRRAFLVGSFFIAAAATLLLSTWPSAGRTLVIALFAILACVLSAASNLVYVYLPELFPTDLRASGIGLAVAASRLGSAVGTFLLPIVVAAYGAQVALGACVAVLVLGGAICYRWAPETKDVRLSALDCEAAGLR